MGIPDTALARNAQLIGAIDTPDAYAYLKLGSDGTAFKSSDTDCGTEITGNGLAETAATVSNETTNVTNDTCRLTHEWTATGSETVREICVMTDDDVCGSRKVISPGKELESGQTITGTVDIINAR